MAFSAWTRHWRLYLWMGALGVLVLAAVIAAWLQPKRPPAPLAPGFTLHDDRGRLTSLEQFRGKVVLLDFTDPVCHEICPLTSAAMVRALQQLGPAARQVQLLGINVNPDKTSVADVAAYTRAHRMEGKWRFLTASAPRLQAIWKAYHVYVGKSADGDIIHQAVIYLIGPRGHERGISTTPMSYQGVSVQANDLAHAMARLLPRGTSVAPPAAAASVLPPAPVLKHRRLEVFFATWTDPVQSSAWERYQRLAAARHLPPPLLIDETPVEPPTQATAAALRQLSAQLKLPLYADDSGQLADAAHVESLPWIAEIDRHGKVLWKHEGWLPPRAIAAALER